MIKLPIVDPSFTLTADAGSKEVFHSFSRGMCPTCRRLVDGVRILRDGRVYLRKQCPADGASEALISGDADWFLKSLTYIKEGSVPLKHSTEVRTAARTTAASVPITSSTRACRSSRSPTTATWSARSASCRTGTITT